MNSIPNQVKIWLALTALMLVLLWVFRGILLPFVVGLALAYVLNPVVGIVERLRIGRGWATAVVLLSVLSILVGLLLLIAPMLANQAVSLLEGLPGYVSTARDMVNTAVPAVAGWLGPERTAQLEATLTQTFNDWWGIAGGVLAGVFSNSVSVISSLSIIIIAPVVAFYMLVDWDGMVRGLDNLLPRNYRDEIQGVLHDIDRSMAGVIRGQGSVILVLCFYYAAALSVTGLSYGLAIGIVTGLLSFIPYVGFAIGFALSMTIAFVQFYPNWVMIVAIFILFMVGQFIEGNVLYPNLVGSSIGIHPVWLMFSLFAFALLFGFVGLLLAVPLSAIAAVLLRYAIGKYQASALYHGHPAPLPVEAARADMLDTVVGE